MIRLQDVRDAEERIAHYVYKTPLLPLHGLKDALGQQGCHCKFWGKMESLQKTGSFKIRGATNRILMLSHEELSCGVVTASSGNHGKGLAFAAQQLGISAHVVIPNGASKAKVDGIRALGAEIIPSTPAERMTTARKLSEEHGWTFVSPFDDEGVMAGQGTIGLEIIRDLPEVDTVILPIGGGGLTSGVATAIKELNPRVRVIAAEPTNVPRFSKSLAMGERVTLPPDSHSVADGIQTLCPGALTWPVVQKYVDEIVTVDEEFILKATRIMLFECKLLAEITSCITIGAILQGKIKLHTGERVVLVFSGGNIGPDQFAKFMS